MISGTFGKAFGSGGAFLACDAALGDQLLQTSGAFRYTTALAPALVGAAQAALELIRSHPDWGNELIQRSDRWRKALTDAGWPRPGGDGPVLPLVIGGDADALDAQAQLERGGLLAVAIRPPTVPEGTARLRLVLRRDLPEGTLEQLLQTFGADEAGHRRAWVGWPCLTCGPTGVNAFEAGAVRSVHRGYGTELHPAELVGAQPKTAADLSFTRTAPAPPQHPGGS